MIQQYATIQKYRWQLSDDSLKAGKVHSDDTFVTPLSEDSGQFLTAAHHTSERQHLIEQLGAAWHPVLIDILLSRGFNSQARIASFLEPKLSMLHDPDLLPGTFEAAQKIHQAMQAGRPIVIYGDYDVDGITASSILWHAFKTLKASMASAGEQENEGKENQAKENLSTGNLGNDKPQLQTYIPHRLEEGYGINSDALREIAAQFTPDQGPITVISVDCGITAVEPAKVARELGIDLIITDHHTFNPDALPDASVIVHPALPGSHYPFEGLCGAGVAYKLAWQLFRVSQSYHPTLNDKSVNLPEKLKRCLLDLLPLAALGTVADVVPLRDENRAITWYGLGRLKQTPLTGLKALIESVGLKEAKIDSFHVGFVLGPRLNACGRMGHARDALKLLTVAEGREAQAIAIYLDQENGKRQRTEKRIVEEAIAMVEANGYDAKQKRAIVVASEGWHQGVVGIVASRLVDHFARPAIVLNVKDGQAHGSARSVEGVCLHTALSKCQDHLLGYGGHAMAAGLRLEASKLDVFRDAIIATVNEAMTVKELKPLLRIDARCDLGQINWMLAQQLSQLAPFGAGNRTPVLLMEDVILDQPPRVMGKTGDHMKLVVRASDRSVKPNPHGRYDAIKHLSLFAPGMAAMARSIRPGDRLDVAVEITINEWQGRRSIEGRLKDIRLSRDRNEISVQEDKS